MLGVLEHSDTSQELPPPHLGGCRSPPTRPLGWRHTASHSVHCGAVSQVSVCPGAGPPLLVNSRAQQGPWSGRCSEDQSEQLHEAGV